MHRADRDVVERIERSFLENGFKPVQGAWGDPKAPADRCALAALLTHDQGTSPFSHEFASQIIDRSEAWVGFFVSAFDEWPAVDDRVFSADFYFDGEYNDRSRGYRAGWKCAERLLSKAPSEIAPLNPAASKQSVIGDR